MIPLPTPSDIWTAEDGIVYYEYSWHDIREYETALMVRGLNTEKFSKSNHSTTGHPKMNIGMDEI